MTIAEQQDLLAGLADLPDEAVKRIMENAEGRERDLAFRFERFHARNPGVYEHLVRLARQAKSAGRERIGIASLFEVLRWEVLTGKDQREAFRLDNGYRSFFARLIMRQEPDLAGFFETRKSMADEREVKPSVLALPSGP